MQNNLKTFVTCIAAAMFLSGAIAWAQPPVTTNLELHYDAMNINGLNNAGLNNGDTITSGWNDLSGNDRHANVVTGTPNLDTVMFGKPVVNFDGNAVAEYFTGVTSGSVDLVTSTSFAVTVFYVWQSSDHDGTGAFNGLGPVWSISNPNGNNDLLAVGAVSDPTTPTQMWIGGIRRTQNTGAGFNLHRGNGVTSGSVLRLGTSVMQLASQSFRLDGVADSTNLGVNQAIPNNRWRIGGCSDNTPNPELRGKIAEILVYSGVLSAADINAVEQYLAAKWDIAIPNAPPVVANLLLHYDATNVNGLYNGNAGINNGDTITTGWNDISGNARHANVVTGTPNLDSVTYSNHVVNFDGNAVAEYFTGVTSGSVDLVTSTSFAVTVFYVWQSSDHDGTGAFNGLGPVWSISNPNGNNDLLAVGAVSDPTTPTQMWIGGIRRTQNTGAGFNLHRGNGVTSGTMLHVGASVMQLTSQDFRLDDDTAIDSTNLGVNQAIPNNRWRIGGCSDNTPNPELRGKVGEILVYSGALSTPDIASTINYLGTKWGVTIVPVELSVFSIE